MLILLLFSLLCQSLRMQPTLLAHVSWNGRLRASKFLSGRECVHKTNKGKARNTVEPPVSGHPKCEDSEVSYGGWSLYENRTIGETFPI